MRVLSERKLASSNKEVMTINIEWDPTNVEQDNLIAYLGVTVDLINKYNRLQMLANDHD